MRCLIGLVVLLGACKNGAPNKTSADERVAELYFTTEVNGYVEPCGCTTTPMGGLPRLAGVIGASTHPKGLVDAGNLLFPPKGVDDVTRDQHLLKARLLARVYRHLGATALNLAPSDLSGGTALLKALQAEGAMPFVSANVRPVTDSGPSVGRSFFRSIGGVKLGLVGVTTPEKVAGVTEGLTTIEYAPALKAEVNALQKGGAEVIVVLAHVSEIEAKELARAVPGLDLILRAPGTPIERDPAAPLVENGVVIAEAGSQGQHVGRVTFRLGPEVLSRPILLDDGAARVLKSKQVLERKIKAYRMEADAWSVDPAKAEAVAAKRAQIADLEQKLAKPTAVAPPPQGPHMRIELVRLTEDVPTDPAVVAMLKAYYTELAALNLEKGDAAVCQPKDGPTFVGSEACKDCHSAAYNFWKQTKHAKAWATLEQQNKHFDLTCVGCHTIGYQQPGGFCRLKDVGVLKDVGCEMCHGAGSKHVDDEATESIALKAPEQTCTGLCHVPEHSDAFVYEKYLRQITGPGHTLAGP